jgi:hypothetical protein
MGGTASSLLSSTTTIKDQCYQYPTTRLIVPIFGPNRLLSDDMPDPYNYLSSQKPIFGDFIITPQNQQISLKMKNEQLLQYYPQAYLNDCIEFQRDYIPHPQQGMLYIIISGHFR